MTDDAQRRRLRRGKIEAARYEVGYGKPPAATRFQKGQSGNLKGRPKGARNRRSEAANAERLNGIILDEAYRTISVRDGASTVDIPMAQAIVRSLAVKAAKGDARSQKHFMDLLRTTEAEKLRKLEEWMETAIEYKANWELEIERCQRLGLEVPEPVPHPDHVIVDLRRGEVRVVGPMTDQEKVVWDRMHQAREDSHEEIRFAKEQLATDLSPKMREIMEGDIRHAERMLEIVERGIRQFRGEEA